MVLNWLLCDEKIEHCTEISFVERTEIIFATYASLKRKDQKTHNLLLCRDKRYSIFCLLSVTEVEERSSGKARGGKLARRARSFKEDFLEKLSHMRSPGSGSGGGGSGAATRAASPSSPRTPRDKSAPGCTDGATTLDKNPLRDLHIHVRQVQLALLHFRDVVSKKKLEMLPGNGTIVLDTVTTIHTVLKSYLLYENR